MNNIASIETPTSRVPQERMNTLMLSQVIRYTLRSRHHAICCSSGSQGYHAFKEMLMCGLPGNTLYLESMDLRELSDAPQASPFCCILEIGIQFSSSSTIRQHVRHLTVMTNSTKLPRNFLKYGEHLTSVDLGNLGEYPAIEELPAGFLIGCCGLVDVDLSPLSHLTSVPEYFLSECTGLTAIDLSPLSNVEGPLPWGFLHRCTGLKAIDLKPLSHIKGLSGGFLFACSSLKKVDLSPLSNVTQISRGFLSRCSGLTEIDLGPLSKIEVVPEYFLYGCSGLKSINLAPFSHISQLLEGFLYECSGLVSVDLSPFAHMEVLPANFLRGCSGLKKIDLRPLSNLIVVPPAFLQECSGLTTIDLRPFSHMKDVPGDFMSGCTGLKSILPLHASSNTSRCIPSKVKQPIYDDGGVFLKLCISKGEGKDDRCALL